MLNSRRDIVEKYQRKGGGAKNKQLIKEKWARNVKKKSNREAGLGYVSYSGKEVPSKIFKEVKQCRLENFFLKLLVKDQPTMSI